MTVELRDILLPHTLVHLGVFFEIEIEQLVESHFVVNAPLRGGVVAQCNAASPTCRRRVVIGLPSKPMGCELEQNGTN